jgi:SpoVK/Ycf46/Vps4 family AAA+-type ATPase
VRSTEIQKDKKPFNCQVYLSSKNAWEFSNVRENKTFDTLFFPQKESLLKDVDDFLAASDFYTSKQQPYKLGILLYGPPGNGKTSIINALAHYTKRNLKYLSLTTVESDTALIKLTANVSQDDIMVIEDYDSFFDGRTPKHQDMNVTYSGLLNAISGVSGARGGIYVITTNLPEVLDKALVRKGRMDKSYLIDNPVKETIEDFMTFFFDQQVTLPSYQDKCKPFASVQSVCLTYKDNVEDAKKAIEDLHNSNEDLIYFNNQLPETLEDDSEPNKTVTFHNMTEKEYFLKSPSGNHHVQVSEEDFFSSENSELDGFIKS